MISVSKCRHLKGSCWFIKETPLLSSNRSRAYQIFTFFATQPFSVHWASRAQDARIEDTRMAEPTHFWSASRCVRRHTYKHYLGVTESLTLAHLEHCHS